ncbi:MAG TPA: hypothetical protein VLQ78_12600 [Ornithinibacter sp.]|nr:hypothetical protein [Ornithinibacter sp.]
MSTPHELRRRLAHGLRLGAAGVVAAGEGRAAVGGARPLVAAKVLGETALLCRVAGRLLADDPALARLEGLGAAQARLGDAVTRALDPQHAALVVAADPHAYVREVFPFALLGDLDTGHRSVARHLLDLVADDDLGDEPDTFDRLERAWLRGLTDGGATAPPLPAGSVLHRGADLLHGELTDAYGLTHAVLHASDCGLASVRTARPAPAVADDAEALLGAALAVGNLDVAAELLWTWPMLGVPLGAGARHGLAELARAEATHGFLPGPEHEPIVAAGLAPADRSTYVIQTSYHTAVVGGILAAALLRTGRPVPPGRGVPHGRPTRRDAAASARPTTATSPGPVAGADPLPLLVLADGHWADALRAAPPARRAACAPLVLGAELRTAAARHDPARVHHLVAWAADHGWSHLPSVRQGATLLTRVVRAAAEPTVSAARGARRRSGPAA